MSTMNPTANFFNRLPESRGYRPRVATSRRGPPRDRRSFSKIGSTRDPDGRAIARPRAKSRSAWGYGCGGASGRGSVTPTHHRGYEPEGAGRVSPMAKVIAVLSLGKEDL